MEFYFFGHSVDVTAASVLNFSSDNYNIFLDYARDGRKNIDRHVASSRASWSNCSRKKNRKRNSQRRVKNDR